jgi:hypothetical protein
MTKWQQYVNLFIYKILVRVLPSPYLVHGHDGNFSKIVIYTTEGGAKYSLEILSVCRCDGCRKGYS